MGVRGLTTFVYENEKHVFDVTYLHDTPLVIDGSGALVYFFSFIPTPSVVSHEYSTLAAVVRDFIGELKRCGITPYFIFDGPSAEEKGDKIRTRIDECIEHLEDLFYGDDPGVRFLGPYCTDTVLRVLKDLHVPYVMSIGDADPELAALANKLNCPVLAEDSDFLIFDLKQGYIPFKKLDWDGNLRDGKKELRCLKSSASKLSKFCRISVPKLPFLSMLLGNDWVLTGVFSRKVYGFSCKFGISRSRFTWRVESVIEWLQPLSRKRDEYILDLLQRSLRYADMEKQVQRMRFSLDLYRKLPDVTLVWRMMQRDDDPNRVKKDNLAFAIRTNLLDSCAYNLVTDNSFSLSPDILSDIKKLSPHVPSSDIRKCAYRLLLRRFCLAEKGPQVLHVEERDRVGTAYTVATEWDFNTAICPLCEISHDFNILCIGGESGIQNTNLMVFRILGDEGNRLPLFSSYCDGKINYLHDDALTSDFRLTLDIIMLSTIYWMKKTNPKPMYVMSLIVDFAIFINLYLIRCKIAKNCEQPAISSAKESDNGSGGVINMNSHHKAVTKEERKNSEANAMGNEMSCNAKDSKKNGDNILPATEKPIGMSLQSVKQPTAQANSCQQKQTLCDSAERIPNATNPKEIEKSEDKIGSEEQEKQIFLGPQWMRKRTSQKAASDSTEKSVNNNRPEVKKSEVKRVDEKQSTTEEQVALVPQWMKKDSSDSSAKEKPSPPTEEKRIVGRKKYNHILNLLAPPPPVESLIPNRFVYQWMMCVDKFPIDLELLHSGAEWSCAVGAVFLLYQAIEYDETNLAISDIFGSNTVLHEINARLHKSEDLDATKDLQHISLKVLKSLESEPVIKQLVEVFVNYLLLVQK